MKYFNFDQLKHYQDITDMFALVVIVYVVIFAVSWIYCRLSR